MRVTAAQIVSDINGLKKDRQYSYVNPNTKGRIVIDRIDKPEGPINIKRFTPENGGSVDKARTESISTEMIWRVANAIAEGRPFNLDRTLGGSYNTRSVLEALMAHTPQFYYCYPGRMEDKDGITDIKTGHKHLVWLPNSPHKLGITEEKVVEMVISEVPASDVIYDSIELPSSLPERNMPKDVARRHAQIQIALMEIGYQLDYKIWIAKNDHGIIYKGKPLIQQAGVVSRLDDNVVISKWEDAVHSALMIDCIWFGNSRLMPAVIEIEHSTGVTSGLSRMLELHDQIPSLKTNYVIAADDKDRDKVVREGNLDQFKPLDVFFLPYSAIEELYSLCQRRKIRGVREQFLESFMDRVVTKQ